MNRRSPRSGYARTPIVTPRRTYRPLASARLSAASAHAVPPITFPVTPLKVKVEVGLGADLTASPATWGWADATSSIYTRDGISIHRGRPDETSTADTSTLAMTADNRDGRWSTRNPMGAWFGQLRKGTPVRVSAEGYVRYTGFFDSLPPRWDVSGLDRHAPLTAKGLLYRLTQGSTPAYSAMRRSMTADNPAAQWPLEDGPDATQVASALSGGTTLNIGGQALMGVTLAAAGVLSGCSLVSGDTLSGSTGIAAGVVSSWEIEMVVGFDPFPTVNPISNRWTIGRIQAPGATQSEIGISVARSVFVSGEYSLGVNFIDPTFGQINRYIDLPLTEGQMYDLRAVHEQNGAGIIRRSLYIDGVLGFTDTTELSGTVYAPTRISFNEPLNAESDPSANPLLSAVAIYSPARSSATTYQALDGYQGEQAHVRFERLCTEEGVLGTTSATESQAMGIQTAKTFLELLRECEASDQGYLYEGLDFGLTFQWHVERENPAVAVALDYTIQGHVAPPLEPTDDDQSAINDVEVKREGGSSSRLTEEDVGVELSIPNIGRRNDSQTYSLDTDEQTRHLAGWRLHMGTFPGYRYPTLALNLAAGPSLITDVCTADLAYRTTIDNPPDDIGPDQVSVIVEGYTETLGQYDWDIQNNCSLAGPWKVGVLAATTGETDTTGWADFDTCTIHTGVNTTAVTWLVDASPVDAATADDLPRDHLVEGELIRVTAVSGASAPQTWTVTRSVNGVAKSHLAGVPITLAYPFILAL